MPRARACDGAHDRLISMTTSCARATPGASRCATLPHALRHPSPTPATPRAPHPERPTLCGCCVRQDWISTTLAISLGPEASTTVCVDLDYGAVDPYNDACADYYYNAHWCGDYDDDDFTSNTMCCACGSGEKRAAPPQCLAEAGRHNGNGNRCGAHVMQTCQEGLCCSRWGWCDFSLTPPTPNPHPCPYPLPLYPGAAPRLPTAK